MNTIRSKSQIYISQSVYQAFTPPRTPPGFSEEIEFFPNWPEPETFPEEEYLDSIIGCFEGPQFPFKIVDDEEPNITHQDVLLLHAAKQRYAHTRQPVPQLKHEREMLVEVQVVGLNPIDWKAPDFGFGLPALPCISGRDMAGKVVRAPRANSRFRVGDAVSLLLPFHFLSLEAKVSSS